MKTQEEIEQLAESAFQDELIKSNQNINWIGYGKGIDGTSKERWMELWIKGYTQCQEHFSNRWIKGCNCGEERIGETWCCNICGLPVDTRESNKQYTESDMEEAFLEGKLSDITDDSFDSFIKKYNKEKQ